MKITDSQEHQHFLLESLRYHLVSNPSINHPRPDTWTLPYNGPGEDNDGGAGRTGALAAIDMAALKLQKTWQVFFN